jgi:multidrug efflux pump subunit AcrB
MTVYVVMVLFFILGITAYYDMPREDFPEIKETKIYISTVYPEIPPKTLSVLS